MTPSSILRPFSTVILPARGGRSLEILCLILTDLFTLILSVVLSLACKQVIAAIGGHSFAWQEYIRFWPLMFVFIAAYAAVGLYSGLALNPAEELRRATLTSAVMFVAVGVSTMTLRPTGKYFTWSLFLAMLISVVLLPVFRGLARRWLSREPWWGSPAVVFGAGPEGRKVMRNLLNDPGVGLKPVAVVDDDYDGPASYLGVPVMTSGEFARSAAGSPKLAYAVVAMPGAPTQAFLSLIERSRVHFSHILMIPNVMEFSSFGVDAKNVGDMLGLEVCQQALMPGRQWPKRALDLLFTVAGGLLILPLIAAIVLWIKIDSPGPALYSQARIGQNSTLFRALKFRTMAPNADEVLERYLAANPELRVEWARDHKLRRDPRVTRAGRFLRRTSLDELPQLWNVLRGEMSLVGPRPIVEAEIPKYGDDYAVYSSVPGGLTGLWQVSGRSDTSYGQRVRLDVFYVRNWSVWLDLYILFRTVDAVLFRKGAY